MALPLEKNQSKARISSKSFKSRQALFATKLDLLRGEYFHIQRVAEDFDAKSLTIKSWSVTLSMAVGLRTCKGRKLFC
jgi:hypothetical protein